MSLSCLESCSNTKGKRWAMGEGVLSFDFDFIITCLNNNYYHFDWPKNSIITFSTNKYYHFDWPQNSIIIFFNKPASTCNHGCKESVFNVLFLVLDFPLGAPNTLLKHVIETSIWGIVVGEGSWWGWGFSLGDWVFDLVGIFP